MNRRGFTLIELLIALCVVGILAAIAIPNGREARERAMAAALLERIHSVRVAAAGLSQEELQALPGDLAAGTVPDRLRSALGEDFFRAESGIKIKVVELIGDVGKGVPPAKLLLVNGTTAQQRRVLAHVHQATGDAHAFMSSIIMFGLDAVSEERGHLKPPVRR